MVFFASIIAASVLVPPPATPEDASALASAGIVYVDVYQVSCPGAVDAAAGTAKCVGGEWQRVGERAGREPFQPRDPLSFPVELPLGTSYWSATYVWFEPTTDEFGQPTLATRERASAHDPVVRVSTALEVRSPTLRIESAPCTGAVCVRITAGE